MLEGDHVAGGVLSSDESLDCISRRSRASSIAVSL
jgi:hypothetical protein